MEMTINDTHEALTELCEAMKGRMTLRERLNDVDENYPEIAKQMDALLEECHSAIYSGLTYSGEARNKMKNIESKLKKAGYGQ